MKRLQSNSKTPKITPARLRRLRKRLVAFAEDTFASLPRTDQRQRGETYLRGLLLDGKRKSIEPMAARLAAADADGQGEGVRDLEQALQQFVNQSPWNPVPVRRRLADRMTAAIRPQAWVIDDTAFPKYGRHSVGWRRSTAGRWARSPTARSASPSTR
jgi:SRSO17 transposase